MANSAWFSLKSWYG